MLKQSTTRNQRSEGFKVKHVLQICALLALCIWLLNKYFRNTFDNNGTGIFRNVTSEHGAIKLGRKDLDPKVQGSFAENIESGEFEAEEEVEESKPEETEDDRRRGANDEIDGRDRVKADKEEQEQESEGVEDLIDEEDREKENETVDLSLLEDETI